MRPGGKGHLPLPPNLEEKPAPSKDVYFWLPSRFSDIPVALICSKPTPRLWLLDQSTWMAWFGTYPSTSKHFRCKKHQEDYCLLFVYHLWYLSQDHFFPAFLQTVVWRYIQAVWIHNAKFLTTKYLQSFRGYNKNLKSDSLGEDIYKCLSHAMGLVQHRSLVRPTSDF